MSKEAMREALAAPQPAQPAQPVASITGIDEYGPMLGWHRHWANFPVGTSLYTAPQPQRQPRPFRECEDSQAGQAQVLQPEQPAEPVNQRAHQAALRQCESWKQCAIDLQERLLKYEKGSPMLLNTAPQPTEPSTNQFDSWLKDQYEYKNWYFREGGTGDMAVPFARKAWDAGSTLSKQTPDQRPPGIDIGWLSNVIRQANGDNPLGAGALAEKIVEASAAIPLPPPPPAHQPLTTQQINSLWVDSVNKSDPTAPSAHLLFARAIEQALGITGG